jgi:septal ring factor EnvC (AmiA/AmiB activator)
LSTLTKVLIVLLTVFSIFLCGIVVTYVANADNQKKIASDATRDLRAARAAREGAQNDLAAAKEEADQMRRNLEAQMNELKVTISDLQAKLESVQRENTQMTQRVRDMGVSVQQANELQASQMQQAQAAQQQVASLEAERTRLGKQLAETDQTLMEKMAIVSQLEDKNKQLTEANQDLETRLNQYLRQYGKTAAAPTTVTPPIGVAQPAAPPAKNIDLNARVTAVDIKNSLAELSIGSAAGARPDMTFHVIRDQQFVCDVRILDVGPDQSVGILEKIQAAPRVGDVAATNL